MNRSVYSLLFIISFVIVIRSSFRGEGTQLAFRSWERAWTATLSLFNIVKFVQRNHSSSLASNTLRHSIGRRDRDEFAALA